MFVCRTLRKSDFYIHSLINHHCCFYFFPQHKIGIEISDLRQSRTEPKRFSFGKSPPSQMFWILDLAVVMPLFSHIAPVLGNDPNVSLICSNINLHKQRPLRYQFIPWSSGDSEIHFLCPEKFTLGQCSSVGFEPGTSRSAGERATTRLRSLTDTMTTLR